MEILTSFLLYVIRLDVSYNVLKSFFQYSNFQLFSKQRHFKRQNLSKSGYRKNGYKFEFEFQIFVQREVWVMGFQELCLVCYET